MLKRILWVLVLLFIMIPVNAGQLEQALKSNENVFLYLYKEDCGLCQKFNPIYNKISKQYSNKYGFLKISTDSLYGKQLAYVYNVRFVPFVVLIHSKDSKSALVNPMCLVKESCVNNVVSDFMSEK